MYINISYFKKYLPYTKFFLILFTFWLSVNTGSKYIGSKASNPFRTPRDPESMLERWDAGDSGFTSYCVTPDTKVEMWD